MRSWNVYLKQNKTNKTWTYRYWNVSSS